MSEVMTLERSAASSVDEDAKLAATARQDPAVFRQLYEKWLPRVYRYCYFRVGNEKDAEDLTSQVFLNAFERLPKYQPRACFSAWLFTIAHSRVMDYFRKGRRETDLDAAERLATATDLLAQTSRREQVEQALRLVRSLSDEEQELIRLRFVAELSYVEMAALLNRREDAVRKAVVRLLQKMQTQMEE